MKKFCLLISILSCLFITGCIKRDSMDDITIYTTVYPIEYITNRLYGENSTVHSIYPDGVTSSVYSLNDKQIKDYSDSDLFIFNGLSNEKNYLKPMLDNNSNLKIIDSTLSMEYSSYQDELWIDPSNALMIARNIKTGFNEYINNHYLKSDIEKNYDSLKVDLSNLSAKLNLVSSSSNDSTIVVSNDMLKFLEKYGYNVISLEENDNLNEKIISDVKNRISNGSTKHIFVIKNQDINETVKSIIDETNVEKLEFHSLSNISENERNTKKDYISIMNDNISLLKQELYK
jgi:zinc transport system substrate-binding protein